MINDAERREVAARLRALPIDIYAAFKEWGRDGLFVDANIYDKADYGQIHNAVFGCFPAEHMHPGDYEKLHERLADLIDRPTCHLVDRPTCHLVEDEHGYTACSECGCTALCMLDASYCPECGARVVRDGD